ncbi:uncharacterized protein [Panulirus ornatus]|uniref:uncharacterized protein n=1 Tax=Panulirus ornatus TaxID=150431 RepID=UPI003A849A87
MRQLAVIVAFVGAALAMPQLGQDNTFTKILSFESYQDGHNFGHELFQEDGTTSGQKFGPDGLLYGFYSYIQQDGNRVKVLWRAGEGVGYEVIGVEGLNEEGLGNLRALGTGTPTQAPVQRQRAPPSAAPVVPHVPRVPSPAPAPVSHAPTRGRFIPTASPVAPSHAPILPQEPTPAPHRFDYPAVLNLERTGSGFVSSLQAV